MPTLRLPPNGDALAAYGAPDAFCCVEMESAAEVTNSDEDATHHPAGLPGPRSVDVCQARAAVGDENAPQHAAGKGQGTKSKDTAGVWLPAPLPAPLCVVLSIHPTRQCPASGTTVDALPFSGQYAFSGQSSHLCK